MAQGPPTSPRKRIRLRPRDVLFLLAVAIGGAVIAEPTFFYPWVHFTGGSFHIGPWWSGAGTFTAPDGKYRLYLYVGPLDDTHPEPTTGLVGEGDLCTPAGKKLSIHISADMDKHLPANTIGRRIQIDTFVRSGPATFSAYTPPGSPTVRLYGIWGVDQIEATGTLDHQAPAPGHPANPKPAPIAITLRKASGWFSPPCQAP